MVFLLLLGLAFLCCLYVVIRRAVAAGILDADEARLADERRTTFERTLREGPIVADARIDADSG